jgi:hypothetical protein
MLIMMFGLSLIDWFEIIDQLITIDCKVVQMTNQCHGNFKFKLLLSFWDQN